MEFVRKRQNERIAESGTYHQFIRNIIIQLHFENIVGQFYVT